MNWLLPESRGSTFKRWMEREREKREKERCIVITITKLIRRKDKMWSTQLGIVSEEDLVHFLQTKKRNITEQNLREKGGRKEGGRMTRIRGGFFSLHCHLNEVQIMNLVQLLITIAKILSSVFQSFEPALSESFSLSLSLSWKAIWLSVSRALPFSH